MDYSKDDLVPDNLLADDKAGLGITFGADVSVIQEGELTVVHLQRPRVESDRFVIVPEGTTGEVFKRGIMLDPFDAGQREERIRRQGNG